MRRLKRAFVWIWGRGFCVWEDEISLTVFVLRWRFCAPGTALSNIRTQNRIYLEKEIISLRCMGGKSTLFRDPLYLAFGFPANKRQSQSHAQSHKRKHPLGLGAALEHRSLKSLHTVLPNVNPLQSNSHRLDTPASTFSMVLSRRRHFFFSCIMVL